MTEYELADSIASMITVLLTWTGMSFTFLTAYLITAYTVGKALTSSQTIMINVFFCIYQIMTSNGVYTSGSRYLEFVQEIRRLNPDRQYSFNELSLYIGVALPAIVTIIAMKFMWDIRKQKTEWDGQPDVSIEVKRLNYGRNRTYKWTDELCLSNRQKTTELRYSHPFSTIRVWTGR